MIGVGAWATKRIELALGETHAPGGVAFGRAGDPFRGEAKIYYDHRHDDDAGGLLASGLVSGVFGHVGVEGLWLSRSGWGARAYGEVGSAGVLGLSLLYRIGALR